jgi:hypothetical protein
MAGADTVPRQRGVVDVGSRELALTAVHEISTQLGSMLRQVEWAADRNRVKLAGVEFWIELGVDAFAVHVTGDAPMLSRLLGGPLGSRLKQIVERTFQNSCRVVGC